MQNETFVPDSNGPWRGYKRDVYEGGIRVPMIVAWLINPQEGVQYGWNPYLPIYR